MISIGEAGSIAIFLTASFSIVLFTAGIYSLVRSVTSGFKKFAIVISIFNSIVSLFFFQLSAITARSLDGVNLLGLSWEVDTPVFVIISSLSIVLILNCYVHNYIRYEKYNTISRKSIKDAIDNLPLGISIYTDSGILLFTNKVMNDIAYAIKEGDEVSPIDFVEEINKRRIAGENEPIIELNGEYFLFKSTKLTLKNGTPVNELIASNITEEYKINLTLKEEAHQLSEYNENLKRIRSDIVKVTAEEEVLNAKIKIHDKLGELLLVSRKVDDTTSLEDKKKIISMWSTTYKQLRNTGKEEGKSSFLSDLVQAANAIGVNLQIKGNIPDTPITNTMLHECLTNTIKHGNGTEMIAESRIDGQYYILTCTNNGKKVKSLTFKGGLKSLQDLALKQNGKLQVVESDGFAIQLILPKERIER